MVASLKAGATLPPIVIDRKTLQVVDGFHRCKATGIFAGKDAEIECIEKVYRTDAERFEDAMKYNATHGRALTKYDRARCVILGEQFGLTVECIAGALSVDSSSIDSLRVNRTAKARGLEVPLKRTLQKFAGKSLTKRQQETNERSSGMNQVFYVNQLIDLLEAGMIDWENVGLIERMRVLNELLESALVAQ
jgi:hypothetical protein